MNKTAKRIYAELNQIDLENQKNPDSKKFIIESTPFGNDASSAPTTVKDEQGEYYIIIGRILPTLDIYNRSAFGVKLKVPVVYPFKPPEVEMLSTIYHLNIGPENKICITGIGPTEIWKPTNTLMDVVNAIVDYIDHPKIEEAQSIDMAHEYLNNRQEFDRKVTEMVEKNMLPRE